MLTIILTVLFVLVSSHESTVDYYVRLIEENGQKAAVYELPERNEEFKLNPGKDDIEHYGNFDFIIVGAGSAGAVLATRLSEVRGFKILLLEAGGEETDFSDIPIQFVNLWFSEMNWGYYTTPQNNSCQGMKDNRCVYFRGKVIGGCSTINALMYIRGNHKDFDKWADLGNPGWSYRDVLPYFKKSENSLIDGDPGYHGEGGLWDVTYPLPRPDTYDNFIGANLEVGQRVIDYNGQCQVGSVGPVQMSIKNGKRASTGRAFLDTARGRKNLRVTTRALATKILIGRDKVARGVEFIRHGKKFVATATKEVLVSAGAINSPQLLMLSGIGPKPHLERLGIKVIENLPVGDDLQDHVSFQGFVFRTNFTVQDNDLVNQIREYLNGYGPLANTDNVGVSFLPTITTDYGAPVLEYFFLPSNSSPPIAQKMFNFNDEVAEGYLNKINPMTDIKFMLILLHPKSKGRVTLKSTDPLDFPNIDINYLSDPEGEDIENLYQGIQTLLEVLDTDAFKQINATFIDYDFCHEHAKFSRDYWYCAIRHFSTTIFHPVRTTQMGPDPRTSVVDHNLKVHGIDGLRVVDAGVIPWTTSGHTNAPTVMIAEKISDTIKQRYDNR